MSKADDLIQRAKERGIIRIRTFNSGGKGGQHSNRTENAVEMTHEDSGVSVTASTSKSQITNKRSAWRALVSKLRAMAKPEVERRATAGFGPRDRVRTYHQPDNRVVDASGCRRFTYDEIVGKGDLAPVIEARRRELSR